MKAARLLCAAFVLGVSPAYGDARGAHDEEEDAPRFVVALIESGIAFAIPTIVYGIDHNEADIVFSWDWPSWRDKLTGDAIRFDTNAFSTNAVGHPIFSVVNYHIGRTNNFGMLGSTVLSIENAILWEFFVEFAEYPSLNDLIINSFTGVQIGEPLYQIGQLWRGGVMSAGDRLKTALFSPLDAIHDAYPRKHPRWWRPAVWRSIDLEAGATRRHFAGGVISDATLAMDIDVVADPNYVLPGARGGRIKAGAWSRLRAEAHIGEADRSSFTGTRVHTRTAFAGLYQRRESGAGRFFGLGTAFTYRRDRLPTHWDHVAIAHLVGPQVQLSTRTSRLAVRFDVAAYGDFALVDAHAFETNPFPRPPPHTNLLQSQGYYDAAALTGTTRFRIDSERWAFDAELDAHRFWQLHGRDREQGGPEGASDTRIYLRSKLSYRVGVVGVGVNAESATRHGTWQSARRTTYERVYGVFGALAW